MEYVIVPIILVMWVLILFMLHNALKAKTLEEFQDPALICAFAGFLFFGPLVILIWFILILKLIWVTR